MPEIIETDVFTRQFIHQRIRPIAESMRYFYAVALDAVIASQTQLLDLFREGHLQIDSETGLITTENPTHIINDGRANEGITQLSLGDLILLLNTVNGVVQTISAQPGTQEAIVRASVRPFNPNSPD